MKNKIIPLILIMIIIIVALSGCIQSGIDNINDIAPTINDHLKKGDDYYNQASLNVNNYLLDNASSDCDNAISEFNAAKSSAEQALTYAQDSNNSVFINYMQDTVGEIDSKLNATLELQQAIPYFQQKDSLDGNSHVVLANQFMDQAIEYKAKKDSLVKQNPSKFKQ